jgi:hypothetical protein
VKEVNVRLILVGQFVCDCALCGLGWREGLSGGTRGRMSALIGAFIKSGALV